MSLDVKGTEELQRLAAALKVAADKDLSRRVSASLRKVGKPVGQRVIEEGAGRMPRRGGLSARVRSAGRVGMSNALRGRSASISLILRNKAVDLKAMDAGFVRHPVYGHRKTWVRQSVPARAFTEAFDREAPTVRAEVLNAMNDTLNDVARKA